MDNSYSASRYQSHSKDRSPIGLRRSGAESSYHQRAGGEIHSQQQDNYSNEEDEYNRRREEEIRKKIYMNESQNQKQPRKISPLRIKQESQHMSSIPVKGPFYDSKGHASFGSSLPERDRSPISRGTISDERISGQSIVPPHVKDHIANIQSDNSSLMRRLNLVVQELDRVQREKEELQGRMKNVTQDASEMQRIISSEDKTDKANRYLSDDLGYERERNQQIRMKIKEADAYKNDLIRELRSGENQQDQCALENQDQTSGLSKTLNQIQDLEKEHYFTQEKIKQLNHAIELLKIECMQESHEKIDLQNILNTLIKERGDLLDKLDHLTSKYDECVREISHDRAEMEAHNRQHAKLVTAKIIFQQLEAMTKNKVRIGFEDFKSYCRFDSKCHNKLQALASILYRVGIYKQKVALNEWFSNALRPIPCKDQAANLAIKINNDHLKQRMFYAWQNCYQQRIESYDAKTQAIKGIWEIKMKDSNVETKRAFIIWKEGLQRFKLQKTKVKKLIWKLYFNKLNTAMNQWLSHSSNVDLQVRLNLLSRKFSQKQYMTLLFNNFRYQAYEQKRKRQNILFHYVKAWRDQITYRKFLMGASVAALQFKKQTDQSLLKSCYDALRQHKETGKYSKIHQELTEEVLPSIEGLSHEIDSRSVDNSFRAKSRACECVKSMLGKNLQGYFIQWKLVTEQYKNNLQTKVKDKVMRLYLDMLRRSFVQWKVNNEGVKLQSQQMIVEDFQNEQNQLQGDILQLNKEIQGKKNTLDCSQKKGVNKCILSYEKRYRQIAMGRWKDQMVTINVKEDGAATVIKRMRTRFLRHAFDLYVAGVNYKKKLQIEEERCSYFNKTRNERLKTKVFNAWCIYKNNFLKSKNYWSRIYLKLDLVMKDRALKRWKQQAQRKLEAELKSTQNHTITEIGELNKELGSLSTEEQNQKQDISVLKGRMTKQAQRVISNAFVKFYYVGETRGFEKWKEFVTFEKHKESLLKKMILHWKKYQFNCVKNTLKNWMINADILERQEQLKREEAKLKDTDFTLDSQTKTFQSMKLKLNNELTEIHKLQQQYNDKLQKSVQMIVTKVDGNHYMSQKRYILSHWRDYVKREKHFIQCIKNVIQKSMWSKGFKEIKDQARTVQRNQKVSKVMEKFRMKFWKRTCGNAFSAWRSGLYRTMLQTIEEVTDETNQVVENHSSKKNVIKEKNSDKSGRILTNNKLKNLFSAWKNITSLLKLQSTKAAYCEDSIQAFQKKCAINKWKKRKDATRLARVRIERLRIKFERIRKMLVFNGIRDRFQASKDFMNRMSNLANVHDHQGLKMGYNAIISYVRAKNYVYKKKQEHSSKDIYAILSNLLIRRKTQYFSDLKYRTTNKQKQALQKAFTVMHGLSSRVRNAFQVWKQKSNFQALAEEIHDEGHVREEVFEQKHLLENCKNFMRDEGYNEGDIVLALKQGGIDKKSLLLKSVMRMKHYNQESYTIPKMFDRWKQFVHLRKLFRYWAQFVHNRAEHIKCDVAQFFDRWKNFDRVEKESLKVQPKAELEKRTVKNSEKLDVLSERIAEREQILDHMGDQREALVDNYIKGQKLALSLWVHNNKRTLHAAFTQWFKNSGCITLTSQERHLRKNIEMITALKSRLKQMEFDNDNLANENEELRQFSLDGYEIAKNVQTLTGEREKLSVDLADKAQTIRKLLDENEKLTTKLRSAQDEAHMLIKSTSKFMASSGQRQGYVPQSPAMRYTDF